ncbi:hypothetical protein SKAU_G00010110 [Synaphobranchus kaupii]|uniref:Uncharacterized protein n=1 Tax=Synaphobranchus kaupii TaxID=118154 RepID=A0A9Q1JC34_SYNKA|nr:hypothetical protein SKAU_G00010110 [Synaphobranchus kaupii]
MRTEFNHCPHAGGRGRAFTPEQQMAIVDMVRANHAIRLREIQSAVIEDNGIFHNIGSVSLSTIDRVLNKNEMSMKQLYRVPFERNSESVKELRYQYVQLSLLDAMNAGYGDITVEDCQGWLRHARRFFPRCLQRQDIRCDVDEVLWPNREERMDAQ